jgi:carbon storage regulator CsrA
MRKDLAMLVLTRKREQQIQIGANITLTILRVKGRSVQIGIEAPGDMRVLRVERDPLPANRRTRRGRQPWGST